MVVVNAMDFYPACMLIKGQARKTNKVKELFLSVKNSDSG